MPSKRKREVTIASMTDAIVRGDSQWINEHLRTKEGLPYKILYEGYFPYEAQGMKRKGSATQLAIVCALRNPEEWSKRFKIFETLFSISKRNIDDDILWTIFRMEKTDETLFIRVSEIFAARADLSIATNALVRTVKNDFPETMKLWLKTFKEKGPGEYEIRCVLCACVEAKHERAVALFKQMYAMFCKRGFQFGDTIVLYASRNDSPHAAPLCPMLLDELNVSPQRYGKIMLHELGLQPHNPIRKAKLEVLKGALYRTDPVNLVAYAVQAAMGGFYKAGEDRSKEKKSMLSKFELGVVQMIVRYCLE
jgi:hypothetical protein